MSSLRGAVVTPQMLAGVQQQVMSQGEQMLVVRQRVAALEARAALEDEGKKPRRRVEFRSQFGEDLWIWDVLGRQTSGFFIEVGAFDGYHFSVSYALGCVGWTGLLIEALPERAEQCRGRRPEARVVHAALGKRGAAGTVKFVSVEDQYGGMLSFAQAPSEHAKGIAREGFKTRTIDVPVTTMNELLKEHIGPIDVAVIDVEGAELDVLDGFDLDRYRPRLLVLEDNSGGRDPRLGQYMGTKPYLDAGWVGVNRVYVRADEGKLLDNLRRF
jgi:FkbM family methyltransferase